MDISVEQAQLAATRHVLQRTGFAESPGSVVRASQSSLQELIDSRLQSSAPVSPIDVPSWVDAPTELMPDKKAMAAEQVLMAREQIRQRQNSQIRELRIWWLTSLINTGNPLAARMTLFWQNHFTSQHQKVRHSQLMYRQQAMLMKHAMGKFGDMLSDILRDPAMLIYLDNRVNRRKKPNENLARELLELFTLGEGHYAENDIRELARALTGLSVNKQQRFVFNHGAHDDGEKSILGATGNIGREEVVQILLAQPATAAHLVTKLWKYFISPTPHHPTVLRWAAQYRESDYDMQKLLQEVLHSNAFLAREHYGQLVKSPIEFIAGTHRVLEVAPVDGDSLIRASRSMQQSPYEPPNVRGWVGGANWINSHTLLSRRRFINRMLRNDEINKQTLYRNLESAELLATLVPFDLHDSAGKANFSTISLALRSPAYHLC